MFDFELLEFIKKYEILKLGITKKKRRSNVWPPLFD